MNKRTVTISNPQPGHTAFTSRKRATEMVERNQAAWNGDDSIILAKHSRVSQKLLYSRFAPGALRPATFEVGGAVRERLASGAACYTFTGVSR